MTPTTETVVLCRILVPVLGLAVWLFYYLDARFAYRMPRGMKRVGAQLSLVLGSVGIFILQVALMKRLAPDDAHGAYFRGLVLIEGGGALVVLFTTLFRERGAEHEADIGVPKHCRKKGLR